jgi:hypothetical protein
VEGVYPPDPVKTLLFECKPGLPSIDLMGDTRQSICKELDVVWIQLPVMVKEVADRAPGVTTVEHAVAKLQRIAHKLGGGVVAATALVLEPWRSARLCEQHSIDCIDLVTCEVMGVKKPAEIVDVVRSLQFAIGDAQELTGEISGMPMTGSTTVVPQPVQVYTGSPDRRYHQQRRNQYGACY